MVKCIGLLALVAAVGLGGILKAEELKERIYLLEDFLKVALDLKSRIQYFRQPLLQLFTETAAKGNSPGLKILQRCAAGLKEKEGEIGALWAQAAEEIYGKTSLTQEDREVICHLGTFIGQTDYENQQVQFLYLQKRLEEQMQAARDIYSRKGPMYRRIGFFGGAIAALVLL